MIKDASIFLKNSLVVQPMSEYQVESILTSNENGNSVKKSILRYSLTESKEDLTECVNVLNNLLGSDGLMTSAEFSDFGELGFDSTLENDFYLPEESEDEKMGGGMGMNSFNNE